MKLSGEKPKGQYVELRIVLASSKEHYHYVDSNAYFQRTKEALREIIRGEVAKMFMNGISFENENSIEFVAPSQIKGVTATFSS